MASDPPTPFRHQVSLQSAWERSREPSGWCRRFGRPADLPRGERVVLVIALPAPAGIHDWTVNAVPLGALPAVRSLSPRPPSAPTLAVDITGILAPRNEIVCRSATATPLGVAERREPLPSAVAWVWLEMHASGIEGLS